MFVRETQSGEETGGGGGGVLLHYCVLLWEEGGVGREEGCVWCWCVS